MYFGWERLLASTDARMAPIVLRPEPNPEAGPAPNRGECSLQDGSQQGAKAAMPAPDESGHQVCRFIAQAGRASCSTYPLPQPLNWLPGRHSAPPMIGLATANKQQILGGMLMGTCSLEYHLKSVFSEESPQRHGRETPVVTVRFFVVQALDEWDNDDDNVPGHLAQIPKRGSYIEDMFKGGVVENHIESLVEVAWQGWNGQVNEEVRCWVVLNPTGSLIVAYVVSTSGCKVFSVSVSLFVLILPPGHVYDITREEGGDLAKYVVGPDARDPALSIVLHALFFHISRSERRP